jgi:tellurite resistance protein TehA-like permease
MFVFTVFLFTHLLIRDAPTFHPTRTFNTCQNLRRPRRDRIHGSRSNCLPHHSRSTALTCSTAWGQGFTILAYVLWWIGMSWIVTVCTTLYISSAKLRLVSNRTLPSIIFLPLVGVMTAANCLGGLLRIQRMRSLQGLQCQWSLSHSSVLAMVLWSPSWFALSTFSSLLENGWPTPEKIPGLILLVSLDTYSSRIWISN